MLLHGNRFHRNPAQKQLFGLYITGEKNDCSSTNGFMKTLALLRLRIFGGSDSIVLVKQTGKEAFRL